MSSSIKTVIKTDKSPSAIGAYCQAVKVSNNCDTLYVSGQIPLDPESMEVVDGGFVAQTHQVFKNMKAIIEEAGGTLDDVVKLNAYLIDLSNFQVFNEIMLEYFSSPVTTARAAVQVVALPKGVEVEADAVVAIAR